MKARYGELTGDILYRINNSALFDTSVAPTRDFHVALMRWDDTHASLTPSERMNLAAEVQLAFDAARANAERLGLNHLPLTARDDAGRAAKAVRLARRASTDGEREAAMAQAHKLLESLALYYLPPPDEAVRMLGGTPPALES